MKKRTLVIHPFLFTLYAVMALFVHNITQIELGELRALLFSTLGALVLVVVMRLVLRDAVKAGLVSSGIILLAFSYGHIETLAENWRVGGLVLGQPVLLATIWLLLLVLWIYGVLKKWRNLNVLSNYLNWVSLILNVFPIYTLIVFQRQSQAVAPLIPAYAHYTWEESGLAEIETQPLPEVGARPDIYYIILDAYTRADVLENLYAYNNRAFIEALIERGFYVASASQANYTETILSISSSLNMVHLDSMPDYFWQHAGLNNEWIINDVTNYLMDQNQVTTFLKERGYRFVTFESGYAKTILDRADEHLSPPDTPDLNTSEMMFEMMLLDTSLGQVYMHLRGGEFAPLQALFDAHRQGVIYTLETMPEVARREGDYFVFAHIVSPHTPFVFGPNGEPISGVDPFTLMDIHPGKAENIRLYRDQLHYLNQLVLSSIDRILENSVTPPIIILQGDHSSKVYSELDPPRDVQMQLLFPILNAYYFPDQGREQLYPAITPVNSFRVLLDYYFGTGLGRLPDRSYRLESAQGRQRFMDVCADYAFCAP